MSKLARLHLGKNYPTLSSKIGLFLERYCTQNAPGWKSTTPGAQYWTIFQQSIKAMTFKSLIYRKSCGFTFYSWGSAHAFLSYLVWCTPQKQRNINSVFLSLGQIVYLFLNWWLKVSIYLILKLFAEITKY